MSGGSGRIPVDRARARQRALQAIAAVGDTPLVRIEAPFTAGSAGFFAKLERHNPGGIKDVPRCT